MRLLGEKQFLGFGQFLAQTQAEGRRDDDPDWYEPLIDPRGVIHCVRVPIAGHRRPKGALDRSEVPVDRQIVENPEASLRGSRV